MKVIHRREEERERRKGGEDRTASEVENTTYPGDGGGEQTFSSLNCLLGYGLTCHFIVGFEIRSLKFDIVGPFPWVSTAAGLKMSITHLSWLYCLSQSFFFFFFKLCMLGFSCPTSTFLLSSCCWCNHILTVIYSLSRKIRIETHISYNWDISIRVNVGFVGFSLYLAHDTL